MAGFLGLLLTSLVIHKLRVHQKKKNFIRVDGSVTHVEKMERSHNESPDYRFAVTFTTLKGETFDLPCSYPKTAFVYAESGDALYIYYHPDNPMDFYAEQQDKGKNTTVAFYRKNLF